MGRGDGDPLARVEIDGHGDAPCPEAADALGEGVGDGLWVGAGVGGGGGVQWQVGAGVGTGAVEPGVGLVRAPDLPRGGSFTATGSTVVAGSGLAAGEFRSVLVAGSPFGAPSPGNSASRPFVTAR